jgi:ferrous iron transport protein B
MSYLSARNFDHFDRSRVKGGQQLKGGTPLVRPNLGIGVKVALAGQPNSGKSTVFNAVAGYRSLTSNFAGTTVEYTHGQARINGDVIDLIDLPGLYSLTPSSPVEAASRELLLSGDWDVLIDVIDASQLPRSLELTLELLDLEASMVVCLNMMDEAARKGIHIDSQALADLLGVPVVESIASRGRGIVQTFRAALGLHRGQARKPSRAFVYAPEAERALQKLANDLEVAPGETYEIGSPAARTISTLDVAPGLSPASHPLAGTSRDECATATLDPTPAAAPVVERVFPSHRFRALQLVEGNPRATAQLEPASRRAAVEQARAEIAQRLGQPADVAISSARHAACLNLFERVARVTRPRAGWRDRIDSVVMHPLWGYLILAAVFLGFFRLIFSVGQVAETRVLALFDALIASLAAHMNTQGAWFAGLKGALLGTAGAVAIVLPYLLPFLIGLAILEDLGYLARVGYLMDAGMHRLGLHGTATLPVMLGYGCSVPAVMATRILASRRDRFVAAFLAVLVPCSARMTVIFALVGFYLGANYALGIYALNLAVVVLAGHVLSRIWPEISPGMLMEVPAYRMPGPRVVTFKTWWRLREFVLVAFPLLVIGSVVLSLVDFYGWQSAINAALSPLTALLGLPKSVGLTLIFGVLRKELSMLMLMQALGTTHVLSVMTAAQIIIFTLFVTFYVPCLATLASLGREIGWKLTSTAACALLFLALGISLLARTVFLFL